VSPFACRFARPHEIDEIARLVAHSFPGSARTPEWWQNNLRDPAYGGGADTLWIGELGGRIVAACQLHPLRQFVGGDALAAAGVGTVAISPAHRRKGLAARLVSSGLQAARARGDVASSLYPFRTAFYKRLGYGEAGEVLQYQIAPAMLQDQPERERVEVLDTERGLRAALALYNRWARTQNGQLERGERVWQRYWSVPDRAVVGYTAGDDQLEGYALLAYRADLPLRERYLEVDELVWTTPESRRALYGWLASLGDQWSQLLVREPASHRFGDWIAEPRLPPDATPQWRLWTPAATLLSGTMFRLLDVGAAWGRRSCTADASLVAQFDIIDTQITANTTSLRVVLRDGACLVDRSASPDVTLRLDVSTLSRIHIASLSPTAALTAGLIECDRPERLPALDAALALPEPWTFDRF
jgi:predicted N-acetyltransferase YhbS